MVVAGFVVGEAGGVEVDGFRLRRKRACVQEV